MEDGTYPVRDYIPHKAAGLQALLVTSTLNWAIPIFHEK